MTIVQYNYANLYTNMQILCQLICIYAAMKGSIIILEMFYTYMQGEVWIL